ncbi:TonB-dependent receptor [Pseudomonas japonica]|uniref:Iron complex outermembrane recepter protein n=1 Tax=Pseudomonas japonica TaxID=256466 RepID=A0A239EIM7_9PSED|nr:TonB-dependent receptor [Pseudomonas japonica]SNS44128.1 iron complex outermembrane recepter protein [Pseudomonas japonica]
MTLPFRRHRLALLITAALLPAQPLLAAEPDDTPEKKPDALPTVTVTAQKREESLQDVAAAVSAVSGKSILETGGGFTAGKALRDVPNAIAPEFAGNQRPRWYIRGMGSGDMASTTVYPVGIYFDDTYISPHIATGAPLYDLERVEILRGPQGTLWGKNTTGGAINFVSRKPQFEEGNGYFKVDAGNYDARQYEGAYGGTLVEDRLAARVAFVDQSRDGQLKNIVDDHTVGDVHDQSVRAQFLARLSDDLDATLQLRSRDYKGQGIATRAWGAGPGGTTLFGPAPAVDDDEAAFTGKAEDRIQHNGVQLNLQWALGELTLDSITAFDDIQEKAQGPNMGIYEFGRSHGDDHWRQVSQELRLSSARNQPVSWIVGTHLFHENLDSANSSAILPTAYNAPFGVASYGRTDLEQTTTSYALFGSSTWQATDDLSLTLGLRWTRETKDIDLHRVAATDAADVSFGGVEGWWKQYTGALATVASQDEKRTWNKLTYDFTPEYQLNDNARVYFRYAKGFRSGGFNGGATVQVEASVVAPENVDAYELGIKSEWFDERLVANANVFYYDYADIQVNNVSVSNGQVISLLTNSGAGVIRGAEFEVQALPLQNLQLRGSLGLLHTELKDFSSPGGPDYSGNRIARSPSRTLSVGASYRIPLEGGDAVTLDNSWRYQSRIYFLPTAQEDHSVSQGGYTLGNASLTYHFGGRQDLDVSAYVNNLTDKRYKTDSVPLPFDVAWDARGDRRTYGVSVTSHF